jgi:glutathione S-transferase
MASYTLYGDRRSGNCYKAAFIVLLAGREKEEAERLEQLRMKGAAALAIMDQALANKAFLAGDTFTVAEVSITVKFSLCTGQMPWRNQDKVL